MYVHPFGWCNKSHQYLDTKYLFEVPDDMVTRLYWWRSVQFTRVCIRSINSASLLRIVLHESQSAYEW